MDKGDGVAMKKQLYQAAMGFYQSKVWREVDETELFALRYADGVTGYCCVMGRDESHIALVIYLEEAGLQSLYQIHQSNLPSDVETSLEALLTQDCLMCSFEAIDELEPEDEEEIRRAGLPLRVKGMPMVRKYQPGLLPWFVQEHRDIDRLTVAFAAVSEVIQQLANRTATLRLMGTSADPLGQAKAELGFSLGMHAGKNLPLFIQATDGFSRTTTTLPAQKEQAYFSPEPADEVMLARIRKQGQQKGVAMEFDLLYLPMPTADEQEGEGAPFFPVLPVAVYLDEKIAPMQAGLFHPRREGERMLAHLMNYLVTNGAPEEIHVQSLRAMDFIGPLAWALGIELLYVDGLVSISREAKKELISTLSQQPDEDDAYDDEEDGDGEEVRYNPAIVAHNYALKPDGECALCGKTVKKGGMLRHLKSCLNNTVQPGDTSYYLLMVQDEDDPNYFIYLSVAADATLRSLDQFLRDIWLECCGHMSAFLVGSRSGMPQQIGMNRKIGTVFSKGDIFRHEYDFGSTTSLRLKVVEEYQAAQHKKKVMLVSRNLAPQYRCIICGQPAEMVDATAWEPLAQRVYCGDCQESMQDADIALPLVNSPRCGVCGYTG